MPQIFLSDHSNAFVSYAEEQKQPKHDLPSRLARKRIAIKDTICTKDLKTTCSSAMLKDFISPYDATAVSLLREAGAQIVGKTNCDEFGMGSHNIHSIHGPVINPYSPLSHADNADIPWTDRELRSAGGSSGGSAAAVAGDLCFAALATDTGGSTRLPAAYCGVAGLKPSYGLISRRGVVSFADSLDCVGILAKETGDIRAIFETLSVYDARDPTSALPETRQVSKESLTRHLQQLHLDQEGAFSDLSGLTIGIPKEYFPKELEPSSLVPFKSLLRKLKGAGATIVPVSLPSTPYALSAYYVIASAEASSNLARYSGIHYGTRSSPPPGADRKKVSEMYSNTRSKGFGREVRKRVLLGTYALTADAFNNYFLQAQRVRQLIKRDFDNVFRIANPLRTPLGNPADVGVDILLHPSAVGTAPTLSDAERMNKLESYVQDVLTVPASLAGLPALSVPIGLGKDGWPLGVSIVSQWGFDDAILLLGDFIQGLVKADAAS